MKNTNRKFNGLHPLPKGTGFSPKKDKFDNIEKELFTIKTVLIQENIIPVDLAKEE